MSAPVFASRGFVAPWDEPDVKDLWCECGHSWEGHENPGGEEKCGVCQGSGVSDQPDPTEPLTADGQVQVWLACGCDGGFVPTRCADPDCDCTRFVERGARTLIGIGRRTAAMLER